MHLNFDAKGKWIAIKKISHLNRVVRNNIMTRHTGSYERQPSPNMLHTSCFADFNVRNSSINLFILKNLQVMLYICCINKGVP